MFPPHAKSVCSTRQRVVQVGAPDCVDTVLDFLKIDAERIQDITYRVKGCGAAIVTSSVASA